MGGIRQKTPRRWEYIRMYKNGINHTTRTYSLDTNYKIQMGDTRNAVAEGIFKAMRGWGLELWIVVRVENRNNSILVLF